MYTYLLRFAQYTRAMGDQADLIQSQNVSMFLANQNSLRDSLKSKSHSLLQLLHVNISWLFIQVVNIGYKSHLRRLSFVPSTDKLRKIPSYEELLCDVVNTCVKMYEDKYYLLSSEKHMLVKVSYLLVQIFL